MRTPLLAGCLLLFLPLTGLAQAGPETVPAAETAPREAAAEATEVPVRFRGEELFAIRAPIGGMNPAQRAAAIESRIALAAGGPTQALDEIRHEPGAGTLDVFVGQQFIVSVTAADANPQGRTREQFAADIEQRLAQVLAVEFRSRSAASLLRATAIAFVLTLGFGLVTGFAWKRLLRLEGQWLARDGSQLSTISLGGVDLLTPAQKIEITVLALRFGRILLALFLVLVWAGLTLSLFPWTRGLSVEFQRETTEAVSQAFGGFIGYLPNLLYITVIALVARALLKLARFFFQRVEREQIKIRNFYPEWADPTYRILRFVGIALAIILMYPYLPASQSTAFQGVSVLLGILVSIGSASALTNMVGGLVITYMRAFRSGDRVRIGDTEGDVLSRDAFVVRIRTVKNVEVTVPNAMVLSSHVINYSAVARDTGVILHTSVTIGYDVPWRKVQALLLAAARKTDHVEADPEPFVLQKSLDDFYVSYELNVHTREPRRMSGIYSQLHAHILDEFNAAGVEIMSPHYRAERDGSEVTIPKSDARTRVSTPQPPAPVEVRPEEKPSALADTGPETGAK